jgi:CMP-N-acetylneuraminic acid synthetase
LFEFDLTAVIPARLNSSRLNEKVFQSVEPNETLLERKINQLRELLPAERVVVNTESEIIADHAFKNGATVHWRDPFFADGHKASFSELISHVVRKIETEHIAWTPFVVPFYDKIQFIDAFKNYENYVINGKYDSLVSVVKMKDYIWDEDKPLNYIADHRHTVSQDLPNWFQVTNGNYMAPKKTMIQKKYLLGSDVYLDVRSQCCAIDIDTLHDLKIAQAYYSADDREDK